MTTGIEELDEVLADLKNGKTATPVTIRRFLSWFGVQRRTAANVEYVNSRIETAGIRTVPGYLNIWVDTPITFELISSHPSHTNPDSDNKSILLNDYDSDSLDQNLDKSASDPSFKIGKIPAANNPPISVSPNASLLEATTLMLSRNFSQLPVMTSDREVKGVVSWESIGIRFAANINGPDVQSYMDDHHEITANSSLFVAIRNIVEHNYVLIRAPDRKISGIVTASDIALQFEEISTPFLLLAEIENNIRILISKKLTIADIKQACGEEHLPVNFSNVADLTFGNYLRIIENPTNWSKISLKLDRSTFCSEITDINIIRNDVMHFDPDPITADNLSKLRNVSKMLDMLRNMGAF